MRAGELARLLGVFALVVAVLLGGTAAAGSLAPAGDTAFNASVPDHYAPDAVLATPAPDEGSVAVDAGPRTREKVVVIDRAHENRYSDAEIQPLVAALSANGYEVRFFNPRQGPPRELNASLRQADAYVVINPTRQFTDAEAAGVEAFAEGGGRVLLMGDPATVSFGGFFEPPEQQTAAFASLGSRFGISFGTGYLYNMRENANNYQSLYAEPATDGPLTAGVNRVVVRDATPVRVADGEVLLSGIEGTRLSTTRRTGDYALAVRSGNVTAVGDTTFVEQSSAYDADNEALIGNLVEFLVTGEKGECVLAGSEEGGREPRPPEPRPTPTGGASGGSGSGSADSAC